MTSPRRLYGLLAYAELVTWTLLLLGMALEHLMHRGDLGVRIAGPIHGFVFLSYCAATVLVGIDQRWRPGHLVAGLVSAVIPYATVLFEHWARTRGMLGDTWRLRTQAPGSALERLVAVVLRRPLLSALVILALVAGMFALLLKAGPPTQWGR